MEEQSPAKLQDHLGTSIHELLHIIGVSSGHFPKYLDDKGKIYENAIVDWTAESGAKGKALAPPAIVEYAKEFYGCPSWSSIPLENGGGSGSLGSHLERTLFFNEVMTGSAIKDTVVSAFTWKMLEDSHWYGAVDEAQYEVFSAGQGNGCDWMKGCHADSNKEYFCKELQATGCNFARTAFGVCKDQFTKQDKCLYIQPYSNGDCAKEAEDFPYYKDAYAQSRGSNARCFSTTILKDVYA